MDEPAGPRLAELARKTLKAKTDPGDALRKVNFLVSRNGSLFSADVRDVRNNWSNAHPAGAPGGRGVGVGVFAGFLMGTRILPKSEFARSVALPGVCLCFALGLGLTSFGIGRRLPFPDVTVRAPQDGLAGRHGVNSTYGHRLQPRPAPVHPVAF